MELLEVQRLALVDVADARHHALIEEQVGDGGGVGVPGSSRQLVPIDVVVEEVGTEVRQRLSTASLVKTALRYPHMGLWTLALIHLQALRLWIKRAPFYPKPEPPAEAWRTRHG